MILINIYDNNNMPWWWRAISVINISFFIIYLPNCCCVSYQIWFMNALTPHNGHIPKIIIVVLCSFMSFSRCLSTTCACAVNFTCTAAAWWPIHDGNVCVTCDGWTAKSSIEYVANVNRSANLVGVGKLWWFDWAIVPQFTIHNNEWGILILMRWWWLSDYF